MSETTAVPLPPMGNTAGLPGLAGTSQSGSQTTVVEAPLTLPRASDVPKYFGTNISMLQDEQSFHMWNFRMTASIKAANCAFLLEREPQTDKERELEAVIYACILDKISNNVLANYMHMRHSIPLLMQHLNERFNPQTARKMAYDESTLFSIRDHISKFGDTLNRIEEVYAGLTANGNKPRDETYKAAITKATPPQYQHVITTIEQTMDTINSKHPVEEHITLTPDTLISSLRNTFNDYVRRNKPRDRSSSNAPTTTTTTTTTNTNDTKPKRQGHAQAARGKGGNRQRGNNRYQAYVPRCFNCQKPGHLSKDCWNEPTEATTKARSKSAAAAPIGKSQSQKVASSATETSDVHMGDAPPVPNGNQTPQFTAWVSLNACTSVIMINKMSHMQTTDIIDSGATIHATPYLFRLMNVQTIPPIYVTLANRSTVTLNKSGTMRIGIPKDKASPSDVSVITLNNVYYHPNMNFSLISQALMCRMGFKFMYDMNGCLVYRNDECIGRITLDRNLYMIRNAYTLSVTIFSFLPSIT